MADDHFWNKNISISSGKPVTMTMAQAGRIFHLEPEPPKVDNINKYIIAAASTRRGIFFTYFLHHYEPRLNRRVYRFLMNEGLDRYDPERFLDYKLSCVLAMIECLFQYDPGKGADFLTYAHYFIGNAFLECRRQEEAGSFRSLDEYKAARGIAWLYNNSGKSTQEVIAEYASQQDCTREIAEEYLTIARQNRSRVPFYATAQDEDGEETGEDVTCDDSWNYTTILQDKALAKAVQEAFGLLSYKETALVKGRGAICRNCGRIRPMQERFSFEELATDHEYSTTSGAERAYKRAVKKLTNYLLDAGAIGIAELKQISAQNKQRIVIYEYRAIHRYANEDDCAGTIQFDFQNRTAKILTLADGDICNTNVFARTVIRYIWGLDGQELPQKLQIHTKLT